MPAGKWLDPGERAGAFLGVVGEAQGAVGLWPPVTSQRPFGDGEQTGGMALALPLFTAITAVDPSHDLPTMFLLYHELLWVALQTDGFPCPPPFGNSRLQHPLCPPRSGCLTSHLPQQLPSQTPDPAPSPFVHYLSVTVSAFPWLLSPLQLLPQPRLSCGPDRAQRWQAPCPTCSSPSLLGFHPLCFHISPSPQRTPRYW